MRKLAAYRARSAEGREAVADLGAIQHGVVPHAGQPVGRPAQPVQHRAQVGGKAANLGVLACADFPVPRGFVVARTAYDDVIAVGTNSNPPPPLALTATTLL